MKKLTIRFLPILILLTFTNVSFAKSTHQSDFGPRTFSTQKSWTAIVAAYEPEIKAINHAFSIAPDAEIKETLTFRGVKYQLGEYKGMPVVVFTTGISVPNAAMTMQMALDYFPIQRVIMMGIAGAINPTFTPGDIAVPERWYFHDESVFVNPSSKDEGSYILPNYYEDALKRYKLREKTDANAPRYENFGFIHPEEMSVIKQGWESPRQMPYFTVTDELLRLAKLAHKNVKKITMPSGKAIQIEIGGNGVTGSVFLDNANYRNWLKRVYNAQVTEMESAAVGQVCFINEVDWIVIRSISDLAGGQHGKNEENVFDGIASGTGTKFMMALLDELKLNQTTSAQ